MQFTNDPRRDLQRTFRKARQRQSRAGSLLALLRSDLEQLCGQETAVAGPVRTPLLAALATCVGIELLAKYWAGRPDLLASTVVDFLTTVGGLKHGEADTLLQFRNAIAHSYALGTRRRRDNRPFSFAVDTGHDSSSPVVTPQGANGYVINFWSLKGLFQRLIHQCKRAIEQDEQRLMEFQVCIRNLGEIAIAS